MTKEIKQDYKVKKASMDNQKNQNIVLSIPQNSPVQWKNTEDLNLLWIKDDVFFSNQVCPP